MRAFRGWPNDDETFPLLKVMIRAVNACQPSAKCPLVVLQRMSTCLGTFSVRCRCTFVAHAQGAESWWWSYPRINEDEIADLKQKNRGRNRLF